MSLRQIRLRLHSEPQWVAFVADEFLPDLLQIGLLPHARDFVLGELLFRYWLYRGDCPRSIAGGLSFVDPSLLAFACERVLPVRDARNARSIFEERRNSASPLSAVESFFTARVLSFREANGIVLVVDATQQNAFPVPFQIRPDSNTQHCVTDSRGNVIASWECEAKALWSIFPKHRVQVLMVPDDSGDASILKGGSFGLPFGLAIEFCFESGVDPLRVLATGAIADGRLNAVEACEAKSVLARKMGAQIWFYPGTGVKQEVNGTTFVPLPEEPFDVVLARIKDELGRAGLTELSVTGARDLLNQIRRWTASGSCSPEYARTQTQRCIEVFSKHRNASLESQLLAAKIHLASLHNHAGQPEAAEAIFGMLRKEFSERKSQWCKLLPNEAVSLCDLGRLDDAEMVGREAFSLVDALDIAPEHALELRIQAAGALGGDVLLHKARPISVGTRCMHAAFRSQLTSDWQYACRQTVSMQAQVVSKSTPHEMRMYFLKS
jgi:hypothetical protein